MIVYHVYMKGYRSLGGQDRDHRWFLNQSTADACFAALEASEDGLSYPAIEPIEVDET